MHPLTNTLVRQGQSPPEGSRLERKLAAIFSTDVAGYSRLMGDDEEATIHTLKTYREVLTTLIERHHGRVGVGYVCST